MLHVLLDFLVSKGLLATGGGAPGPDPLRRPPPPHPPPCWFLAGKCRTMGAEGPKEILLELVEGEKMGFQPMCPYSNYSGFSGEPNNG